MNYNTSLPKLKMREYGRNIQQMIDHCKTIEDREERTRYAYKVAEIMTRLFHSNGTDDDNKTVWDHMNIISNFSLDIDFPYEVIKAGEMKPKPENIPYAQRSDNFRCYGDNLIRMIREVAKYEGGVEKDTMIFLIANQMKKLLVTVNADSATDRRVFKDIKELTGGTIDIDPENYRLNDYIGTTNEIKKRKKK